MPTYKVDAHGATFRVESPVDLTDEQVWAAVQPQADAHRSEQVKLEQAGKAKGGEYKIGEAGFRDAAKSVADETSMGGRFMQGVGETFDRYAGGLKKIFTDLTPEDKQRLQQNKVMSEEGGVPAIAGQVAGDLAITAPLMVGGAAAAPVAANVAGRMLPQAVRNLGANVGRNYPAVGTAANVAATLGTGAAVGAVGQPMDSLEGAAWGAGGAALGGLPRAVRAAVGGTGRAGTAGRTAREIGENPEVLAQQIEAGMQDAARFRVPVTAAEASGNPTLAARELGVRAALPEEFAHHTRQQNEALHREARRMTEGADDLVRSDAARTRVTAPLREEALRLVEQDGGYLRPLLQHVRALQAGPTGANPAVARVANLMEEVLMSPNTSAAHVYERMKFMLDKLSGPHMPGDEIASAVKSAERETMAIKNLMDDTFNRLSGNKWEDYLGAYRNASRYVDDSSASAALRESLDTPGRKLVGNETQVTARTLERDIAAAGDGRFGDRFLPLTRNDLNELSDFAKRIAEPMSTLKLAGTGGGGSQTSMQLAQLASNIVGMLPVIGNAAKAPIQAMIGVMKSAEKEALARLLIDPQAAVDALRRSAIAGAPLSPAEQVFVQLSRAAGRNAGPTGAAAAGAAASNFPRTMGQQQEVR